MSLTPVDSEKQLTEGIAMAYQAQKDLATARDVETAAEIDYKRAKVKTFHDGNCPKVTRGGYTVADKDAWIDEQIMAEWIALKVATTAREVCQDKLRVILAVQESARSLNASVRQAYSVAGAA